MKRIELTEEQFKVIVDSMTKEQIKTIRDALATEMDCLRDKLCVLYDFDDILADAFYNKEESNESNESNESKDDSEEV